MRFVTTLPADTQVEICRDEDELTIEVETPDEAADLQAALDKSRNHVAVLETERLRLQKEKGRLDDLIDRLGKGFERAQKLLSNAKAGTLCIDAACDEVERL